MKGQQTGKKYRIYYIGATVVLVWILLPVFAKTLLFKFVDTFHAPVQLVAGEMGELQDHWALRMSGKNQLIDENRKLSRALANERLDARRKDQTLRYIERLEQLLKLGAPEGYRSEYARVVRRDSNAWLESVQINKGSNHGIKKGYAVIAGDGLVGKVVAITPWNCEVELVTSPNFRATVNIANDERPIAFQGSGRLMWDPLSAHVHHVPQDFAPHPENRLPLFTTGLGEGLPQGLYVGDLVETEAELEGLFKQGTVEVPEILRVLREVVVLIPLTQGD